MTRLPNKVLLAHPGARNGWSEKSKYRASTYDGSPGILQGVL